MSQNARQKTSLWQVVKFTLFSASAGILQVAVFTLLETAVKLSYWPSYLIALVASVLWNFTFNRRYTFRSDANLARSMLLVALFYAVFTPLSTWWGDALTRIGWNDFVVLAGTMAVNFVTEFLYQRFVVYRNLIDTNDVARRASERGKGAEG
ncbi:MAG: GtrA family protein [Clostridiales bacterium]|nr:GtrA family protein [Clostridiales bacterium]MDO4351334.1 GtrA family protein [Eubacteriales bacterium]MDY4007802.1 GtrA family protein [Candidatus Limiplasma sp.]